MQKLMRKTLLKPKVNRQLVPLEQLKVDAANKPFVLISKSPKSQHATDVIQVLEPLEIEHKVTEQPEGEWSDKFICAMDDAKVIIAIGEESYFQNVQCRWEFRKMVERHPGKVVLLVDNDLEDLLKKTDRFSLNDVKKIISKLEPLAMSSNWQEVVEKAIKDGQKVEDTDGKDATSDEGVSLFHGLDLSLGEGEQLGLNSKVMKYLNSFQKVMYVIGHGSVNQYYKLEDAVDQLEDVIVNLRVESSDARSWQEKILLIYGGDPNDGADDIGKLLAEFRRKLPGVNILAVQCDEYKKYALAGGPSYYHIDAFYFYPTQKSPKMITTREEKMGPLYGGYVDVENQKRIPVGTTKFLGQIFHYWSGMICIGGGEIARKELVYFKQFESQHPEYPKNSRKELLVLDATVNTKPFYSEEDYMLLTEGANEKSKTSLEGETKFGVLWREFFKTKNDYEEIAQSPQTWYKLKK